ncbi:hypothetical protein MNV49_003874 [Pseudohyphozyma bogoriensis]|nr:hypothetical protein MNV49_003874 [Pseudohyphozyma bogoriensis]
MSDIEKMSKADDGSANYAEVPVVNASGHKDQLARQYSMLDICCTAISIDSAWYGLGGSVVISMYNGGGPGVLYELLVACLWYCFISACLAEFSSSIPSSAGVYHWATACGGKNWGPVLGYYTGALSWAAWLFGSASLFFIPVNCFVQIYQIHYPDYVVQPWNVFVTFLIVLWTSVAFIVFCNHLLPYMQRFLLFFLTSTFVITIVMLAVMPKQHASHAFVWTDFQNLEGWSSNGLVFLAGVLNGAYTIGTPEAVTHLAEELPNPRVDLPKAIAAQMTFGTVTAFCYGVVLMYSISDFSAILDSTAHFPLAAIYQQATNNNTAATTALLVMMAIDMWLASIGALVTCGRCWWALSRDGATPLPKFFARVSEKLSCPVEASVFVSVLATALGAIQLGSSTAFNDLAGSFAVFSTLAYAIPTTAHVLTGRKSIPIGPFWMGRWGYFVNITSVLLTVMFVILFCFPYSVPIETATMNYTSVILAGYTVLVAVWWIVIRRSYVGPHIAHINPQALLKTNHQSMSGTCIVTRRESLRWPPAAAYNDTDVLVLTIGKYYLDLRVFTEGPRSGQIDWSMAGVCLPLPGGTSERAPTRFLNIIDQRALSSTTHPILPSSLINPEEATQDLATPTPDDVEFTPLPDTATQSGRTLERGRMPNPGSEDPGKYVPFEEVWQELDVPDGAPAVILESVGGDGHGKAYFGWIGAWRMGLMDDGKALVPAATDNARR